MRTVLSKPGRFYEIDVLRGFAVILMVIYHFLYDLDYFGVYSLPSWFWPQQFYGFPITDLFVLIAGVSLVFSAAAVPDDKVLAKKLTRRGLKIFALGLLITLATWIYPHDGFIVFGILHLIGISTILAIPFLAGHTKSGSTSSKNAWAPLVFGLILLLLGPVVRRISGPPYLIPLGICPPGFSFLDYEPLIPWFGVILIGIALGFWLYPNGVRKFSVPERMPRLLSPFSILGQHSLVIYLIHQPVILLLLWLFGIIQLGF
ncbi:heparan-alpha-glucosaminide N-acetyltransferase [Methanolapillus millepedarum]|uniref:Heparan-alpha-glucosaminide N-acetyltransferase catalytic domain-containing protein n=1 Tax=Methanolapillus millepedarum TaxID=3028296 RepID=A0AA96ZUS9_9EURY|nr:hypothetical protein MsAc7_15260 [Methanosarcinaceae archaeon Ac7]